MQVCNVASNRRVQYTSSDYNRKNIVVCDVGDTTSNAKTNTLAFKSIDYLGVHDGDLWVADTINASIGLHFILPGVSLPVFIHLQRDESLGNMNNGQSICKAMRSCTSTQQQSLARGTNNYIFTENGNTYCCIGAQPGRAERGVQSGLYRQKYGFPSKEWDSIHRVLKRAEYAFNRYMDTDLIQHISCARSRVKFKMMEPSQLSTHKKLARHYNGLGFGINVYLRSHIDRDFTMSIVQAHIDNYDYQVNDSILCYFALPIIRMAVACWPGDFLLLNPQELHSISSCCITGDKIFCIISYLEMGVVGLNDNSNPVV